MACSINKHAYLRPRLAPRTHSLIVMIVGERERRQNQQQQKKNAQREQDDQRPNNLECVPLARFLSNPDSSSLSHHRLCGEQGSAER